ncbi:Found in mitochondrial proteome 25-like protein [Cladobotryum mycophilum]|uniref:Found in mitochondrial proteome 25-like protein n=1 Tax=Cladobotryum mycophilum TaxID=491253 RepID=A0ABR0SV88_9HYPO
MNVSQLAIKQAPRLRCPAQQQLRTIQRQGTRYYSNIPPPQHANQRRGGRAVGFAAVFVAAAAGAYYYPKLKDQLFPEPEPIQLPKVELEFEKPRQKSVSKEDHRDLLSSQHLQVKNSWEHPGVYAWGSNAGKVIDPASNEKYVKLPRRIAYFNDQLLRDLKLTQGFGAALTENGDLVQWGAGFSRADPTPVITLKSKDLVKIQVSADRIIALSRNGAVYAVPSSRDDQQGGSKPEQKKSSWSLWSSSGKEAISFQDVTPANLGRGEKVTDISSGLEHCLMLTSKGRVFAAASSISSFPSKGQMGVPGLNWETRRAGRYDQAYEIETLKGFHATQIGTGDYHSVVLDKLGRVFTFGDNAYGQLGFEADSGLPFVSAPAMLPLHKLYGSNGLMPKVTSVAAGGLTTFFTCQVDAPVNNGDSKAVAPSGRAPPTIFDAWAMGQGTAGSLGTGKWTHVTTGPTKVKGLSSLFEFDEKANKVVPIKLKSLSIGTTHCAAVMDNVTETNVSGRSSENETNWGSDVVFWGGNEHYQLGTGKRSNMNAPTYIGPLDGGEGDATHGRKGEMHRLCLTPRQTARLGEGGKGRRVTLEQKVECGRFVTGVYSAV